MLPWNGRKLINVHIGDNKECSSERNFNGWRTKIESTSCLQCDINKISHLYTVKQWVTNYNFHAILILFFSHHYAFLSSANLSHSDLNDWIREQTAAKITFTNMFPYTIDLYYSDESTEGTHQGVIEPNTSVTVVRNVLSCWISEEYSLISEESFSVYYYHCTFIACVIKCAVLLLKYVWVVFYFWMLQYSVRHLNIQMGTP